MRMRCKMESKLPHRTTVTVFFFFFFFFCIFAFFCIAFTSHYHPCLAEFVFCCVFFSLFFSSFLFGNFSSVFPCTYLLLSSSVSFQKTEGVLCFRGEGISPQKNVTVFSPTIGQSRVIGSIFERDTCIRAPDLEVYCTSHASQHYGCRRKHRFSRLILCILFYAYL